MTEPKYYKFVNDWVFWYKDGDEYDFVCVKSLLSFIACIMQAGAMQAVAEDAHGEGWQDGYEFGCNRE